MYHMQQHTEEIRLEVGGDDRVNALFRNCGVAHCTSACTVAIDHIIPGIDRHLQCSACCYRRQAHTSCHVSLQS